MIIFAHPIFLWLLPFAPLAAWLELRAGGRRPWRTFFLRMATIAAAVLALSGPMLERQVAERTTVLVVDVGRGMPDGAFQAVPDLLREAGNAGVRVIAYSNQTRLIADNTLFTRPDELRRLRDELNRPLEADDPPTGGAVLAAALQLAGAQVPEKGHGRVLLISNALATRGDAAAEAYRLAERGIAIEVRPVEVATAAAPPVLVRRVIAPASARAGQTLTVDVTLQSVIDTDAVLSIRAGSGHTVSSSVNVRQGENRFRLRMPTPTAGLVPIMASVRIGERVVDSQAAAQAAVLVGAPARVMVVQSTDGAAGALARILGNGAAVNVVTPNVITPSSLAETDCVVLADVAADDLSTGQQRDLADAVSSGVGLVVTGAARSFGPGGYATSSLASLLPVKMPQQAESVDPSTALVLIIDTSGSMSDSSRIDLAKEVARLAISHLTPHDKVGIVEFYGGRRWAAPIQSAANASIINRALNRLTAGGGTTLYPAVEEAAFALRNVYTRSKHVLVLSDGGVENAPFATLLRQMVDDGISVSAVAVAPDNQPNMMPDLARWGGGRFYSVPDRFALPDISLKQPNVSLLSPLVQKPTKLTAVDGNMLHASNVESWPALSGYVRTIAKPTADVLLRTQSGDPLLTQWRYGAGFVAVLPTQIGSRMTDGLQNEPGFAKLLADLFRQVERTPAEALAVQTNSRPGGVEVDLVSAAADPATRSATLRLTVQDERGRLVRDERSEPSTNGHWNILLPDLPAGVYTVGAQIGYGKLQTRAAVAVPQPRDVEGLFADEALLNRIRSFSDLSARRAAELPPAVSKFIDESPLLAVVALVLFLTHVAVRRWPVDRRQAN